MKTSEAAKRLGVNGDKIRHWIDTGELLAVNTAASTAGRPKYWVTEEDFAAFVQGRKSKSARSATGQQRRPGQGRELPPVKQYI